MILIQRGHCSDISPPIPAVACAMRRLGIHTGVAFVGSVGSADSFVDFTALGDAMNTAARIASKARAGEILMSDTAFRSAHLEGKDVEERSLELKGKNRPVAVRVLHSS